MTLFDSLYDKSKEVKTPLADRMRPKALDDFVGQKHLVGEGTPLRKAIEGGNIFSMILWGPPGSGKTTLAQIISNTTDHRFISFSAVTSGIKQIKEVMETASFEFKNHGKKTILFIDEIHRFNKAQQDAFLPYIETGKIIMIGATTENPSFEVNSALLSRCKVYILSKLEKEDIKEILQRALKDEKRGTPDLSISDEALEAISSYCDGDARIAYNILEIASNYDMRQDSKKSPVGIADIEKIIQKKLLLYDKGGEEHFNLISALHKSLRGSDPDAAAYWTARMIEGGEDPLYIIRRLVRFASEDVGLADPNALSMTLAAKQSFEFIGPPEGYLAIIEASIYLALAPKSNALYKGYSLIKRDIQKYLSLEVPLHIRNAPTRLMKDAGYGKGYQYAHDYKDAISEQQYLPDKIRDAKYYLPTERGFEKELKARLDKISEIKKAMRDNKRS